MFSYLQKFKGRLYLLSFIASISVIFVQMRAEAQYCQPYYNYASYCYMYITRVNVNTINYSTGCIGGSGYANYTGISTNLAAGTTYSFTVTFNNVYSMWLYIYIDLDRNNSFASTERVYASTTYNASGFSGTFTIPSNASTGSTRMRVMSSYQSYPISDPCQTTYYGETEDYTVVITPPPPDAGITAINTPTAPFSVGTQQVGVTLKSFGKTTLTSCYINWSVNGITQPQYYWTGSLGENQTTNVNIGSYNFSYPTNGPFDPFTVRVWTSLPNGGADGNSANDSYTKDLTPILNDASVVGIFGPAGGFPPGYTPVTVRVKNNAPKPLTSVSIGWSVDGTDQTPYTASNLNIPWGGTADIVIGSFNFFMKVPVGPFNISANTFGPNGVSDEVPSNDAMSGQLQPALIAGTYTVGGSSAHFPNLTSATNYINTGGIFGGGRVNININSGTYDGQVNLSNFPGAGNSELHFNSSTGLSSDVTISYTPLSGINYVVHLEGLNKVYFNNLTFRNNASAGSNAGRIFEIINCNNINFTNNNFIGVQNPSDNDSYSLVHISNSDNLNFQNNNLNYGSIGILLQSTSQGASTYTINNNRLTSFSWNGIKVDNMSGGVISSNTLVVSGGIQASNGIWVNNGSATVTSNSISGLTGNWSDYNDAAIRIENWYGRGSSIIRNNIINQCNYVNGIYANDGELDILRNEVTIVSDYYLDMSGIYSSSSGCWMESNINENTVNTTDANGIRLQSINATTFNNKINVRSDYGDFSGIRADNSCGNIVLNMVSGTSANGISVIYPNGLGIYYNSVYINSSWQSAFEYGGYGYDGNKQKDKDKVQGKGVWATSMRNLFINGSDGYALSIYDSYGLTSDENDFFTSGEYLGTSYIDLAAWQNASGQDMNSINVMPAFKSATDLHLELFNEQLYVESPPLFWGEQYETFERYDWDGEYRDVFYFGVDHLEPTVTILEQPNPIIACQGTSNHEMNVLATVSFGGEPLFQWQKDGVDIPGETNPILYFDNVTFDMSGVYRCRVSGTGGAEEVTTDEVLLYVLTAPEITRQPQSYITDIGNTVTVEVQAHVYNTGAPIPKLQYQWYKGTTALSDDEYTAGAQQSILSLTNIQQQHLGDDYYCVVTGLCGFAQSDNFSISLKPVIEITQQPSSVEECEDSPASFSVVVNVTGLMESIEYQWYKDGNKVIDDGRILGATTATLNIANLIPSDAGMYAVEITVQPGDVVKMSDPAGLMTKAMPVITQQPAAMVEVTVGESFDLEVAATGYEPLSYQWYFNDTELPGETNAKYSNPSATFSDAGAYKCLVKNECGDVESAIAVVTVNPVNISSVDAAMTGEFSLSNVPNPFSEETNITFVVPADMYIRLALTDVFGREVAVLKEGVAQSGNNEMKLNSSTFGLSSGVYYYTLTANGVVATKKMVVVK